jgi:hypothetical protein
MRVQLHQLQLVYPPISNQEAEWIKDDVEVQNQLKNSNLYFIAQKPESFFLFYDNVQEIINNDRSVEFKYKTGTKETKGKIDLDLLLKHHSISFDKFESIEIEIGPKLIRIWLDTKNGQKLIDWFTTEKILTDRARNKEFIVGLDDYREFSTYNLHYIGISKSDDSLKRLVIKPHDKRLRILSNEHPLSSGSRITDEIFLFFFEIDSIEIKQYLAEADFHELGTNNLADKIRIVADAEKAFVKILKSEYNTIQFKSYPVSSDGLYESNVEKYSFSLNEDIVFITSDNTVKGERHKNFGKSNSDFILIDKKNKEVELVKID